MERFLQRTQDKETEKEMTTKLIRIAVIIDDEGNWACGGNVFSRDDNDKIQGAAKNGVEFGAPTRLVWIEVDVPLADPYIIKTVPSGP